LGGSARGDAAARDSGRPEPARSRSGPRGRVRLRGDRPSVLVPRRAPRDERARARIRALVEAIILAGGKAERLGEAAQGRPKALVHVAGRPLAAYQIALLEHTGVDRVIVSCAAGKAELFERELAGSRAVIVPVEEPEPLGR